MAKYFEREQQPLEIRTIEVYLTPTDEIQDIKTRFYEAYWNGKKVFIGSSWVNLGSWLSLGAQGIWPCGHSEPQPIETSTYPKEDM